MPVVPRLALAVLRPSLEEAPPRPEGQILRQAVLRPPETALTSFRPTRGQPLVRIGKPTDSAVHRGLPPATSARLLVMLVLEFLLGARQVPAACLARAAELETAVRRVRVATRQRAVYPSRAVDLLPEGCRPQVVIQQRAELLLPAAPHCHRLLVASTPGRRVTGIAANLPVAGKRMFRAAARCRAATRATTALAATTTL